MNDITLKELILRLIYPVCCPGCGSILKLLSKDFFCDVCYNSLPFLKANKINNPVGESVSDIISFFSYKSAIKKAIRDLKFNDVTVNATAIIKTVFDNVKSDIINELENNDLIIPVPLHNKRQSERGYNQSELLAYELSKKIGILYKNNILKRYKNTKPQSSLERRDRLKNLDGAFKVINNIEIVNRKILLVDDVMTTGATLEHCARVLLNEGALKVTGLTVAIREKA